MLNLTTDIRSLSEFKRNTAACMEHLKASGNPLVLTVNGKAEIVVQDASGLSATDGANRNAGIPQQKSGRCAIGQNNSCPAKRSIAWPKQHGLEPGGTLNRCCFALEFARHALDEIESNYEWLATISTSDSTTLARSTFQIHQVTAAESSTLLTGPGK